MAEEGEIEEPVKCPECPPGLPGWLATFSDLVTLLLTFFVLLLSFAKTESAKYEAALGSIRNAFGGNVLKHGEVIQRGKSPDDSPSMIESEQPIRPFPIDFLTMEGILDKHEINRESTEDLKKMKRDLKDYSLNQNVTAYTVPEGVKIHLKDKIYFKEGSLESTKISVEVLEKTIKLLKDRDWNITVIGHADRGEKSKKGNKDSYELASARSLAIGRFLIKNGVRPDRITIASFGDAYPDKVSGKSDNEYSELNRRVEFILRKTNLQTNGNKVDAH
jgi:chemotaxis protein MotB